MFIILSIYSKNSNSLTHFLKLLYKFKINTILNLKFNISQCQQFTNRRTFSTLKSPHVNKKSQEQFEFRVYKKQLKIDISQLTTFLTILKIVKSNAFADISITINLLTNPKLSSSKLINKTSYDKFLKKFIKHEVQLKYANIKFQSIIPNRFLRILDIHGEVLLKVFVWIAQSVRAKD